MGDSGREAGGAETQAGAGSAGGPEVTALLEPLRSALSRIDERERYRLLGSLLVELAEQSGSGSNGRGSAEQVEALTKKIHALNEEKAMLKDSLGATQADLDRRTKQFDAEQERAEQIQQIVDDQRTRLEAIKQQNADLEAQLVARNAEIHRAEVDKEELLLNLQRAQAENVGQERIDSLERSHHQVDADLAAVREEMDQLRVDKDAEIDRLNEELREARSGAAQGADKLLSDLWQRLASAKPSLVQGHVQPPVQCVERMVDAFVELVRFVDDFDKSMRVFLGKYTKHHPSVKVPWDVYVKRDDVLKTVEQTLAVEGGKPVGVLKMRLRVLYSWAYSGIIGCDSAVESIASELHTHMMGPAGVGSDPNRKLKEYLREDGHELFLQHMRELRTKKLAETYGRGG